MKNILLYSLVIILILSTQQFAQWNFSLATSQEYSDNPFRYPNAEESFISSYNVGIEHEINSFGIGYYGNYSTFSNLLDRNYYWHQFGLWKATEKVMFGLYAEQRINQTEYDYFNYTNYNAYVKYKTNFNSIIVLSQAALTLTNYNQLSDLDNWLTSIGIKLTKSFETKTTLIGGAIFNYKNYYTTNLDNNQTYGMGKMNSSNNSSSANTSQISYYGRIAQSITSTTGLAMQYTGRSIIGGTAKSVRELEYAYGDESQYFDDPISYEGYTLSAQLTQIFPSEIVFKAAYSYNYKEYPSQGIYLDEEFLDDGIIRLDKQQILNLSLAKSIYLNDADNYQLNLSLGYQSIFNSSNSYWYDYKSSQINLGLDFQF